MYHKHHDLKDVPQAFRELQSMRHPAPSSTQQHRWIPRPMSWIENGSSSWRNRNRCPPRGRSSSSTDFSFWIPRWATGGSWNVMDFTPEKWETWLLLAAETRPFESIWIHSKCMKKLNHTDILPYLAFDLSETGLADDFSAWVPDHLLDWNVVCFRAS